MTFTPSLSARHVAVRVVSPARGRPLPNASGVETSRLVETRREPQRCLDAVSSRRDETETATRQRCGCSNLLLLVLFIAAKKATPLP